MGTSQRKRLEFSYAFRSFMGHLEGTQKAAHTIKSYRLDLKSFEEFLNNGLGSKPVELQAVTRQDLEKYHNYLKAKGYKSNTRRRMILTIRKVLRYLVNRGKLKLDAGDQIAAPIKVEKSAVIVSFVELRTKILDLPETDLLSVRNKLLLWLLLESGCLVSEIAQFKRNNLVTKSAAGYEIEIGGKFERSVPISQELGSALNQYSQNLKGENPTLFQSHNGGGCLGIPISSRGVELLVRSFRKKFEMESLTPRVFRKSVVLNWYEQGIEKSEIRKRLGLKSDYAFRAFEPLFRPIKSNDQTTSIS